MSSRKERGKGQNGHQLSNLNLNSTTTQPHLITPCQNIQQRYEFLAVQFVSQIQQILKNSSHNNTDTQPYKFFQDICKAKRQYDLYRSVNIEQYEQLIEFQPIAKRVSEIFNKITLVKDLYDTIQRILPSNVRAGTSSIFESDKTGKSYQKFYKVYGNWEKSRLRERLVQEIKQLGDFRKINYQRILEIQSEEVYKMNDSFEDLMRIFGEECKEEQCVKEEQKCEIVEKNEDIKKSKLSKNKRKRQQQKEKLEQKGLEQVDSKNQTEACSEEEKIEVTDGK